MKNYPVRWASWARTVLAVAAAFGLITCTDQPTSPTASGSNSLALSHIAGHVDGGAVILVGAGNVARCDREFDEQTAALLDGITEGTVFTIGDNAYGADLANCYEPSWGRHKDRTRPAPGDLDYPAGNPTNYFTYFGSAAGDPTKGYYSYDIGSWHVVVLNSSTSMTATSPQVTWLTQDLAQTTQPCVMAYWHFPRFSSFGTGVRSEVKPLWDALYAARADVVVNAHYRLYERFGLQTPTEQADPARGIRQFIVGTGGQGIDGIEGTVTPRPNSEVRASGVYGVIKFSLGSATYAWEFLPVAGSTVTDSGDAVCHGRPGGPPIPNQPPTADAGGPYVAEASVTFDGSASRDIDNNLPLTYAWTFNDGTTAVGVSPHKAYSANGTYTATLVVTDALGLSSTPETTTITIQNLGPQVNAGPDGSVQVNSAFTMKATFTDEGGTADGPWSWTIAWGDGKTSNGTTPTLGAPITVNHTYTAFGEYQARVTVSDDDQASGFDDALVTVRDPKSVAVLVGAGDIVECGIGDDERTAALLDNIAGTVITLGDNVYLSGSPEEYANCYHTSWGRHKSRTKPAVGNHDYATPGAAGYFGYFGAAAGDPDKGYYSYTSGEWLVIVLNSASGSANRSATSPQVQWLRTLLASTTRACAVAYMHHPQFTSTEGRASGEWNVIDLWNALYEGGVDLVLSGHDHLYERFAPMRPDGTLDSEFGIRQITAGMGGGEGLYRFGPTPHPNSQKRNNTAFGVLKVTLRGTGYDWQFVGVPGAGFTDTGSGTCHGRPGGNPPPNQAPTAQPGGPYQGENTISFNGSGSTDPENHLPLSYYWTFGDGTAGSGAQPTKTYATNGTFTTTLVVTDAFGLSSAPATTTVTVANAAPVVNAGPDADVSQGTPLAVSATFTDAGGPLDAPWRWTITWGDGATSTGTTNTYGGPINASHPYSTPGPRTVRVTVTDKDGGSAWDEIAVTVTPVNMAPIANPGGPYQADQTVTFDGSGSTDPDGHLPLTYAWSFGDGTTGTGVSPTKTYNGGGPYTVSLTVTDSRGLPSAAATTSVTIANAPPVVNAGPDATIQFGSPFTLNASFTDEGGAADGPWTWTIAWGDGTTTDGTANTLGGPITATRTFEGTVNHTVRVTVRDKDGGEAWDETVVRVSGIVFVGAGNIARCDAANDEKTATLLDGIAGTVFTLGDNVYGGSFTDFANCYGPTWGRHLARTRPAAGDIEYVTAGAPGYFSYFGAAAGDPANGYYSYNLGTWHIVVLNNRVPMGVGSPQEVWLKSDLAATTQPCILAYWHFPRFSSSGTALRSEIKPLWDALYTARADVVLNAHARVYERFALQDPAGSADPAAGMRQFTVGTGGQGVDVLGATRANSEVRSSGVYGVLKLSLDATSYSWEFVPVAGQTFTDTGTTACH